MNLKIFEGTVRNIKEDPSVERIEMTTIPMTKDQAVSIGQALVRLKDVTIEINKNEGRQIILFDIDI